MQLTGKIILQHTKELKIVMLCVHVSKWTQTDTKISFRTSHPNIKLFLVSNKSFGQYKTFFYFGAMMLLILARLKDIIHFDTFGCKSGGTDSLFVSLSVNLSYFRISLPITDLDYCKPLMTILPVASDLHIL